MNTPDAIQIPARELKDELARLCLPGASRDPNRKLGWMNSICILFLLIGIFGSAPAAVSIKPVPPVQEIAPVLIETEPPPQTVTPTQVQNQNETPAPEAPSVTVVVPPAPNINFSVPTIGNLVAPNGMATAPPLTPMEHVEPMNQLAGISTTGAGGSRPQPPYPQNLADAGAQGTITFLMRADTQGRVAAIQIKRSSGYPDLDRVAADFIKRHWILPSGGSGGQFFQTSITYRLAD